MLCLQNNVFNNTKPKDRNDLIEPLDLTTYRLDPTYTGRNLTTDQIQMAHQLILTKDPHIMAHLCRFQAEAEPFLECCFVTVVLGKLKPGVWWLTMQGLSDLANIFFPVQAQLRGTSVPYRPRWATCWAVTS